MMAVYCDELNKRVLVGLDSIFTIKGFDGSLRVSYTCLCGRHGVMDTGRRHQGVETSGHIGI